MTLQEAQAAAMTWLGEEAGFAQLTTIDHAGYPVGRTTTAFVRDDWSVDLVQRRVHARLAQLERAPRALVTWVGPPGPGSRNDHPHVFDVGLLIPRAVFVRGATSPMTPEETEAVYREQVTAQRERGLTKAPLRDAGRVAEELTGVHLRPVRVRLEGFGDEARAFDWTV